MRAIKRSKIVAQGKPNNEVIEKFFKIKEKQKVILNDKEFEEFIKKYSEKKNE